MQAILFKACSQAGTSRWSDTSLQAVKALPEKLICISPLKLSFLVVDVLPPALVTLFIHYFPHYWILHCNASKFPNVIGC